MRMRFCAMMRSPAFSITALMAPVRLRAVASGLRMENVRSTGIGYPQRVSPGRAYSWTRRQPARQGARGDRVLAARAVDVIHAVSAKDQWTEDCWTGVAR